VFERKREPHPNPPLQKEKGFTFIPSPTVLSSEGGRAWTLGKRGSQLPEGEFLGKDARGGGADSRTKGEDRQREGGEVTRGVEGKRRKSLHTSLSE